MFFGNEGVYWVFYIVIVILYEGIFFIGILFVLFVDIVKGMIYNFR